MALKSNISISDFDVKSGIEETSQAVLSHYLHNYENPIKKHYQKDALSTLKKVGLNKQHSISNIEVIERLLLDLKDVPFPTPKKYNFQFIDLFAGVGGFRLALQNVGGKCVFTSEWNIAAQKTYQENFGKVPFGDITKEVNKGYIPQHFDILCAGFPCQAFSIAGYQKGFAPHSSSVGEQLDIRYET